MTERSVAPRSLAALLLLLWVFLGIAILVAYRPGGPADLLVGAAAFFPAAVVSAGLVWPPTDIDPRIRAVAICLGLASALLIAPLILLVIDALLAGGRQTLLPSLEEAYAAVLAFGSSCAFTAMGIARRLVPDAGKLTSRLLTAAGIGGGLTLLGTVAFGGVAIANEQQLREQPAPISVWGPTDAGLVPPPCHETAWLGAEANVTIEAAASIDREPVAQATVRGVRSGTSERWSGVLEGQFGEGELSYDTVADGVSWSVDGAQPEARPTGFLEMLGTNQLSLDGPILAAVSPREGQPGTVAEDLGFDLFDGATARHCRRAIDGPTALNAVLALRWITGQDLEEDSEALPQWRGAIDWWTFGDGQMGRAIVTVSGYPGEAFPATGVSAMLEAELSATHRGSRPPIRP
ncbi:MAG: hypothetical protein M3395_09195 [Chloroflexota bacterium]|nr:hypothetical protein [Chloroflexota bacterium]